MEPSTMDGMASAAPLVAFVSVLAGALGVPIPSLAAVIFSGSLIAVGHGDLGVAAAVFGAALAGTTIGDVVWFFAGRRFGGKILSLVCRLSLSRDSCVRQTADMFARTGLKILLVDRFAPGLSIVAAPLAGASGILLHRFVLFAEAGAAIWIATGLTIGFLFAGQVSAILHAVERIGLDLGAVTLALVLAYAAYSWFRRYRLIRRLRMTRITVQTLAAMNPAPAIIDTRSNFELDSDPFVIPGARRIHDAEPSPTALGISMLDPVVVYCSCPNEISAAILAQKMRGHGFTDVRPLLGGIEAWRNAGYPVAPITPPGDATTPDTDSQALQSEISLPAA